MKQLIALLIISSFLFSCKKEPPTKPDNLIAYTPRNATVVIRVNDFNGFKSELINNDFLKLINNSSVYKNASSLISTLDYIEPKSTALIAFNEIGKNKFEYTFISKNHNNLFKIDSSVNRKLETITYENASIKALTINDKKLFSTTINNYFIGSSSRLIIENFIRNSNNLQSPAELQKLYEVSQRNVAANIFVNHKKGRYFFEQVLSEKTTTQVFSFNDWTSLDASIAQDYVKLNGIAVANDSIKNTLNTFKRSMPKNSLAAEITPINATYFISYPSLTGNEPSATKVTDSLFHTVSEMIEIGTDEEKVFAFLMNDNLDFEDRLQKYVKEKKSFRDYPIWALNQEEIISLHFSKFTKGNTTNFVSKVDDFYVFAENESDIESIISNYQNSATLAQLPSYKNLRSELADESTILGIGNLEKLKSSNNILNEEFEKSIENKSFDDYKFIAFQYIAEGDFAHFHTLLKKANTSTVQSNIITQMFTTTLDADIATRPQFVLNHYTKKKEIVVQDTENNLYLIGTDGKLLWKKQLEGKILGDITQVDLYRNGRLQLAFTTDKKFRIVDRNGEDVNPFPLEFNSKITQPLAVFDYSNNKDYRFLVVMGKQIKMYNRNADIVDGFILKETENTIINPPKHIRIGNKDYIILQESDGKLDILHRTGDVRIRVKGSIDFSGNEVYLYDRKFTTTNTSGDLIQVDQKGGLNKIEKGFKENHLIDATIHTLTSISENKLSIKDNEATLDFGIYTQPKIFYIGDKIYVSTTDKQTHKVYLFDSNAKMIENFPVYGDSAIDLDDMDNDKNLEFVTVGDKNSIICYKLN
ncbi:ribonuclease HII [Galbibacter mesophilus]|uniref:ribonuclease HII n=1 Tax=Galbibacter mesophilus TaxID=379069 RepID=UPI00191FE1FE|nr:ribonuclease HII [Galbibacter mesophilus]MCM5661531.1 ribonuclease HII [Galbibacter mesophilus]